MVHHFFFQAEDGIRDYKVTGVQTCALPIYRARPYAGRLRGVPAAGAWRGCRGPGCRQRAGPGLRCLRDPRLGRGLHHHGGRLPARAAGPRSEEHTSELQSPCNLVCRLLLEKKKKKKPYQCPHPRLTNPTSTTAPPPPATLPPSHALTRTRTNLPSLHSPVHYTMSSPCIAGV